MRTIKRRPRPPLTPLEGRDRIRTQEAAELVGLTHNAFLRKFGYLAYQPGGPRSHRWCFKDEILGLIQASRP